MTLADYLQTKNIDSSKAIVEYKGEIYAPGSNLTRVPYTEGDEVSVFKVVAGG